MHSVYQLKPLFQSCLRPLLPLLVALGVSANQVTSVAALSSLAYGAWMWRDAASPLPWLFLPLLLLLRMALNVIDGMLAREYSQQSRLGAVLNEVGDVVSDAALYLPFALVLPQPAWVVTAVMLAWLTEFVAVLGPGIAAGRPYQGPMGKSARAVLFGAYGLLLGCWPQAAQWGSWLFGLSALLLLQTCLNRARYMLRDGDHV